MRSVYDMNSDPMLVLDGKGAIVIIYTAFVDLVGITEKDAVGRDLFGRFVCLPDRATLASRLRVAIQNDVDVVTESAELVVPGGARKYTVTCRAVEKDAESAFRVLLRFTEER